MPIAFHNRTGPGGLTNPPQSTAAAAAVADFVAAALGNIGIVPSSLSAVAAPWLKLL